MKRERKEALEKQGWDIGTASDFLGLSAAEEAYIELKLSLARALRAARARRQMTQEELAKKVGSSQSRVDKMESGEEGVSVDLLVRTLLALGETRAELAGHVASSLGARDEPAPYDARKRARTRRGAPHPKTRPPAARAEPSSPATG